MNNNASGMSRLAFEAGFGTRVWSYYGYLSARYFYPIIGTFIALILYFSFAPYFPLLLALVPVGLYLIYFLLRQLIPSRYESQFYNYRVQLSRAQLGIWVLFCLAWLNRGQDYHSILWVLYLPSLLIISRHCSTRTFILSVGQVCVMIAIVRWGSGLSPGLVRPDFSIGDPDLVVRCLGLGFIAFMMHYLGRNIDARNDIIRSFEAIESLSEQSDNGKPPTERWQIFLETYLRLSKGTCGTIWLCNRNTRQIRSITDFRYCLGRDCPLDSRCDPESLDLSANHPIAQAVRTGKPVFCQTHITQSDPLISVGEKLHATPCLLPAGIFSRIVVPMIERQAGEEQTLGVLCIDFERENSPRPYLLPDYFDFLSGLARRVKPLLRHVQQIEELQALQHIGHRVTSNLKLGKILDEAVEAVVKTLGFEFATISLVDPAKEEIRTMVGYNVAPDWIKNTVHSLHSDDIQADIVRKGHQEVLSGWDARFDQAIWQQFNHEGMIRVFTPILGGNETGQRRVRGTIEAGYYTSTRDQILDGQRQNLDIFAGQLFTAIENAELFKKTQDRAENLASLHRIGWEVALARSDLSQVLNEVGQSIRSILRADIVMIYRYNGQVQVLEKPQVFGDLIDLDKHPLRLPSPDRGIIARILSERQPYYITHADCDPLLIDVDPNQNPDTRFRRTFTQRQGIVSFAGVPMIASGTVVGVLCVNYRNHHTFSRNHRQVLEIAAQFAAVALHNAETNQLTEELISSRERMHLATQLHHSLSQYLPAIRVIADTAIVHLNTARYEAIFQLEKIKAVAQKAITETRVNIFELNAKSLGHHNLREVLEDYAHEASGFFNLKVELQLDAELELNLSHAVARELLMVCREGITNAAKYAGASRIKLELQLVSPMILLRIQDDGCGFDVGELKHRGRRGLRMLQERVDQMGGQMKVTSLPGTGTMLEAEIPLD
jgi:signal transduction histidine kinase